MRHLHFTEASKTKDLLEKGYAIFSLLSAEDVSALHAIFWKYHAHNPEGFYATTHLEDTAMRKQISDEAMKIVLPCVEGLFENIHVLGGAFITKAPGQKGILPLHQDWNIVDEGKERSYNLWIPLVDVHQENGTMRILEGSHRKQFTLRGPEIPPVLYPISDEVDRHMIPLEMKAGEALMYDHALWHSSPENQSTELRIALVLGVVTEGAEMRYYQKKGEIIEEYASHPDFFFENERGAEVVNLEKLRDLPYENDLLNTQSFRRIYLGEVEAPAKKKRWFSIFGA
jgi:hypothetical protein